MELTIRAGPVHRPRIEHLIAGAKQAYLAADGFHDASGVIAQQHKVRGRRRLFPTATLHVDRIDRYGLDRHEQVARAWGGPWQVDFR